MVVPLCQGLPDEEYMSADEGLVENHYYRDLRGMDLHDLMSAIGDGIKLQALFDEGKSEEEIDAICHEHDLQHWMMDLDPCAGTAAIALSALTCVPFTSCDGGPGHHEQHPLVGFWCPDQATLNLVCELADEVGCSVDAVNDYGALLLWHGSNPDALLHFAAAVAAYLEPEVA